MQAIYSGHLTLATLDAYRQEVRRTTTDTQSFRDQFIVGALGVAGEVGELNNLIKKQVYHLHEPAHEKIRDEAGDVAWYAVFLLNIFDVSSPAVYWPQRGLGMSADYIFRALHCSLLLAKEAGAIADLADRFMTQDAVKNAGWAKHLELHINEQVGKVLYYLARLLSCYDITLQQALDANVAKLHARYPLGWDPERSRNRDEAAESEASA